MLWSCTYRVRPGYRAGDLARRFIRQHDAGTNRPANLRGWYLFATGSAGTVHIEAESARELSTYIDPYSDLVEWHVEALTEMNYNQVLEEFRRTAVKRAQEELMAGTPPAVVAQRVYGGKA
jgi:hypothetical protein